MWRKPAFLTLALLGVSLLTCAAQSETRSAVPQDATNSIFPIITKAAQLRQLSIPQFNQGWPVRLEGVVTFVDTNRNLIVLQDASGAVAVRGSSGNLSTGERIRVESSAATQVFPNFPEFPGEPSGSEWRSTFAGPTNAGGFYLARMRGFLNPPATGDYTFWLGSKGSSELWLSTKGDPANIERIAYLSTGCATAVGQWEKYPTQVSLPIRLEAGKSYLIDVIQEQLGGREDWLAVSWSGPNFDRTIIDGKYLSPFNNRATNGIVREFWNDYFLGTLDPLLSRGVFSSVISVTAPRITPFAKENFPEPLSLSPGDSVSPTNNFRWTELEGTVEFAGVESNTLTLELADEKSRSTVRVLNWSGDTSQIENTHLRVRGVCELVTDGKGNQVVGQISVPSPSEILELEPSEENASGFKVTPISDLTPANPNLAWGRRVRVRGTFDHEGTNGFFIKGAASFSGSVSTNGINWQVLAPAQEVLMANRFEYSGLAISSFVPGSLSTATFDSITPLNRLSETADVFGAMPVGTTLRDGSTFTFKGGGVGISSSYDQFHFTYEPLAGDREIVARITSLDKSNPRAIAGIMIRDSLEPTASFADVGLIADGNAVFQFRQKAGERGETVIVPGFAPPCWMKLTQRHVSLFIRDNQPVAYQSGQEIDVIGSLIWENGSPLLSNVRAVNMRTKNVATPSRMIVGGANPSEETPTVAIARLVPEEGEALKPGSGSVRVRGVVTFNDHALGTNYLTIQDQTAGVMVKLSSRFTRRPLSVGDLVEFDLRSLNGKLPMPLEPNRMNVIGRAQLPDPATHPAELLLTRRGEAHWTQFEGVVQEVNSDKTLVLMCKDGPMTVWIDSQNAVLRRYIDAAVRIRGVLLRTVKGPRTLAVPSLEFIQIVEAPPQDPFVLPTLEIAELRNFNRRSAAFHRVKTSGVVTYKSGNLVVVQGVRKGVRVRATDASATRVGDLVDVVGFPKVEDGAVSLSEALIRKNGRGVLPEPAVLGVSELLDGAHDMQLVRLSGQLLEQQSIGENQVFEMQSGQRVFRATLGKSVFRFPAIPIGSVIEVTGICRAQMIGDVSSQTGSSEPLVASIEVLLRTPTDIVVRRRPPWWTWKHTAGTIGGLLFVLGGAVVWIRLLHQQVAQRTGQLETAMSRLEHETEVSATLAERNRLAGELHDGLEQGLSAIMMQLDGLESKLSNEPEAGHHLKLARNMVRFSRTEVRHSLFGWKSSALADRNLSAALSEIVTQMSVGNTARVSVEVPEALPPLPPAVEHHLLRIGQEALNNALKYAHANAVHVKLQFSDNTVRLIVQDDGVGFIPGEVLNGAAGHLGLQSLRGRARKIGGNLNITSAPGRGAAIEVVVPLKDVAGRVASPENLSPNED